VDSDEFSELKMAGFGQYGQLGNGAVNFHTLFSFSIWEMEQGLLPDCSFCFSLASMRTRQWIHYTGEPTKAKNISNLVQYSEEIKKVVPLRITGVRCVVCCGL
jgi:hypothetical protein